MALQDSWTDYQARSIEVKELVKKLIIQVNRANGTAYTPEIAYEDNEWGAFDSSYLYKALTQMMREKALWDKETILERLPQGNAQQPVENTIYTDEGDEFEPDRQPMITQPLNWFKSRAPEKAIRIAAQEQYEQRLLALYLEHVETIGQTFYPELQSILENQFDFDGDS